LWDSFEASRAECVLINLNTIMKAIKESEDWRAAAWLLPRLRPDEFGDKQNIKAEHSGEIKITINSKVNP